MKRRQAGFTLVELIVVIAILGILAGIAIPVYSNYIKKANKAADLTLLGAVNTAVGSATIENDQRMLSGPTLRIQGKKIVGLNANETGVSDSFLKYFGTNSDTELKFFESSADFEYAGGNFYPKGEVPADAKAAQQSYVSTALQNAWEPSSFNGKTTEMANALSGVGTVISNSLAGGQLSGLADKLNPESENYNATIAGLVNTLGLNGLTDAMINSEDGSFAAVKYIAGQTAGISGNTALTSLNNILAGMQDTSETTPVSIGGINTNLPTAFLDALKGDGDDAATNLGIAYAAATAYYNSDAYSGTAPNAPTSLSGMFGYMMGAMSQSGFNSYMQSSQAATDLNAYTAAMAALNSSDATDLSSDTLNALLTSYLGG